MSSSPAAIKNKIKKKSHCAENMVSFNNLQEEDPPRRLSLLRGKVDPKNLALRFTVIG